MRGVYAHNPGSQGAKLLSQELGIKRVKHEGSRFRDVPSNVVINWGASGCPFHQARVFNPGQLIGRATNKLLAFQAFDGHARIPEFTASADVARGWVSEGAVVVARTILQGHSGAGIVIIEKDVDFVHAPLYTKYVKKEAEFRVHCFRGQGVFDIQRKIRDPGREPTNWQVRNHDNGFIYVRDNIVVPEDIKEQALRAFDASGLDFGAVDVIWNSNQGKAYVLEINTAPGLTGRSLRSYSEAFKTAFASLGL